MLSGMASTLRRIWRLEEWILSGIHNLIQILKIARENKSMGKFREYSECFPTVRPCKLRDRKCLCAISWLYICPD